MNIFDEIGVDSSKLGSQSRTNSDGRYNLRGVKELSSEDWKLVQDRIDSSMDSVETSSWICSNECSNTNNTPSRSGAVGD